MQSRDVLVFWPVERLQACCQQMQIWNVRLVMLRLNHIQVFGTFFDPYWLAPMQLWQLPWLLIKINLVALSQLDLACFNQTKLLRLDLDPVSKLEFFGHRKLFRHGGVAALLGTEVIHHQVCLLIGLVEFFLFWHFEDLPHFFDVVVDRSHGREVYLLLCLYSGLDYVGLEQ